MANKIPEAKPEAGWGEVFHEFVQPGVTIQNHAKNGRSSRSFIGEGSWETVLQQLKKGDYVFIQFGHNDQKDQTPSRFTNPYTGYQANLRRFVNEARAKGARPVLFSSVVRRNFNEKGTLIDTHGAYPLAARLVAQELNVPFIDLQLMTEELLISMGPEESKELFLWLEPGHANYPNGKQDNTHFNEYGARQVAKLVATDIKKQNLALKKYIK